MPLDDARAAAAAARARRAALLAEVASGQLPPEHLDQDPRAADVKAVAIAETVPGVGKVRARRVLDGLGVAASALWGDLPARQRHALTEALTADGGPPAGGP